MTGPPSSMLAKHSQIFMQSRQRIPWKCNQIFPCFGDFPAGILNLAEVMPTTIHSPCQQTALAVLDN